MSELRFVHVEQEVAFVNGQRVGSIRVKNGGNVLTNIKVEEEHRGNGHARTIIEEWLENCREDGFAEAYIANVNHGAIEHIVQTLDYPTTSVLPRKIPADTNPGPLISPIGLTSRSPL